jgi:hypothetical protein
VLPPGCRGAANADGESRERGRSGARPDLRDHLVERHRGEQGAIDGGNACSGQSLSDPFVANPHPLGAADQGKTEQRRQDHADFGREIAFLDRVADEEDRREGQRDGADPQKGATAQSLLPADPHGFDRRYLRSCRHERELGLGLQHRLRLERRRNLCRRRLEGRWQGGSAFCHLPPQRGEIGRQAFGLSAQA